MKARIDVIGDDHVLLLPDMNYASGRYTIHRRGTEAECLRSARQLRIEVEEPEATAPAAPIPTPKPEVVEEAVEAEATPAAKALAEKLGVDLADVEPGESGKIGVAEVRAARK